MKKALALVLALVLALSMAVSAFAATIVLEPVVPAEDELIEIEVVTGTDDYLLYTTMDPSLYYYEGKLALGTEYYLSLGHDELKDIKLTANGNITAELVKFDPETMILKGVEKLHYTVLLNGKEITSNIALDKTVKDVELDKYGKVDVDTVYADDTTGLTYHDAKVVAKLIKNQLKVKDTVAVVCEEENVNIIKVTVADNFGVDYTIGTLKVEAYNADSKKNVADKIAIVNDVAIFEYEQVKWAAENNAKGATLKLGDAGYSAFFTDGKYGRDYDPEDLRDPANRALVVSTTAFRAIEGKDLTLDIVGAQKYNGRYTEISVTLKDIAAGQKGVNFFAWAEVEGIELDPDEEKGEVYDNVPSAVSFGFLGNQVIKGEYEITVALPVNYYELRELFGLKVEEEDIISYYVVDENNNVVKTIKVDYMTDDITDLVEFSIEGANDTLGWYTLCLEVPANETTDTEANPNTGAESVVGVVAALAVVSVATAAAVSLKK